MPKCYKCKDNWINNKDNMTSNKNMHIFFTGQNYSLLEFLFLLIYYFYIKIKFCFDQFINFIILYKEKIVIIKNNIRSHFLGNDFQTTIG
jgi:hypothetical protein